MTIANVDEDLVQGSSVDHKMLLNNTINDKKSLMVK
jgi:hypothetical protein